MIFNYLVGPQSEVLFILDVYSFDTVEDAEKYIELVKDLDREGASTKVLNMPQPGHLPIQPDVS